MATSVSLHVPLVVMAMSVLTAVRALMETVPQWMEHVTVIQDIPDQHVTQVRMHWDHVLLVDQFKLVLPYKTKDRSNVC